MNNQIDAKAQQTHTFINSNAQSAIQAYAHSHSDGRFHLYLLIDGIRCTGCVRRIERLLTHDSYSPYARVHFSTRRLHIAWQGEKSLADHWVTLLEQHGYKAAPFDPEKSLTNHQQESTYLLKCLAVAGFANANVMLFSIPLWSADIAASGDAIRTLFQWIQCLIVIPALAYAGRPFFHSAWKILRQKATNMDVPISVAIILTSLMSLGETLRQGPHAYFDSVIMLVFFLLVGRYLESRAKGQARGAAEHLLRQLTGSATILHEDGSHSIIPCHALTTTMMMRIHPGEKIHADGIIEQGQSEVDTSLLTGEVMPCPVQPGDRVFAGTLNGVGTLQIRITQTPEHSLLSEIIQLMEQAEHQQARYVTLADRLARFYTPLVHGLAAITFIAWWQWGDIPWQISLLYAATVLIITCPCALGLAVPVVHVLANSILMKKGILLKSAGALERLPTATHLILDKTGTLTEGKPRYVGTADPGIADIAASLAAHSKHPLALALCQNFPTTALHAELIQEIPGNGIEATILSPTTGNSYLVRLGRYEWSTEISSHEMITSYAEKNDHHNADRTMPQLEVWFCSNNPTNPLIERFDFQDPLRSDAAQIIKKLQDQGLTTLLLSGDKVENVHYIASALGMDNKIQAKGALSPISKMEIVSSLKNEQAVIWMVGDGLNDAPALSSANISMSPSSGIDITQHASDVVFQGKKLQPLWDIWQIAHRVRCLIKQNFALAIGYNAIAVPLAMAGYVTPLIAAIAMSSSSLLVIANAMRLYQQSK
jgi:Cu2+-exporting ATPase